MEVGHQRVWNRLAIMATPPVPQNQVRYMPRRASERPDGCERIVALALSVLGSAAFAASFGKSAPKFDAGFQLGECSKKLTLLMRRCALACRFGDVPVHNAWMPAMSQSLRVPGRRA